MNMGKAQKAYTLYIGIVIGAIVTLLYCGNIFQGDSIIKHYADRNSQVQELMKELKNR